MSKAEDNIANIGRMWRNNPEPMKQTFDPQTILDIKEASYDAYLWSSKDCSEQWLAYTGQLSDVEP